MAKNKDDDLEVLVDVPITDTEKFYHLVGGIEPAKRPVKMKYKTYQRLNWAYRAFAISILLFGTIGSYSSTKQEHGSLSKVYEHFIEETIEKYPSKMFNSNF